MGTGSSPVDRTSSKPCESSFTGFFLACTTVLYRRFRPRHIFFQGRCLLLLRRTRPKNPVLPQRQVFPPRAVTIIRELAPTFKKKISKYSVAPAYRGDSPPGTRKSQSLKARIFPKHLLIKVENEQVHKSTASIFLQHVPIIHHFKVDIWSCGHVVIHAYRGDCVPRGQSRRHSQSNQGIRDFFPICIYCHVSPGRAMGSSNHIIFSRFRVYCPCGKSEL